MAEFQWTGTNRQGRTLNGTMEGKSRAEVKALLESKGVTVTNIKGGFDMSTFGVIGSGVKQKELATFTRQFSVMINAGLPLVSCLQILSRQQENKIFKNIITDVTSDVERAAPWRTPLAATRRCSANSTSTWWPPESRAVSWTPSSADWLTILKTPRPCSPR